MLNVSAVGVIKAVSVRIEEIPARTGKALEVEGHRIAIFRLGSGEVRAVENRSPYRGGPLAEGLVSGEFVYCPLYDWKISLADGQVQEPDTGAVRTYPVEVREGRATIYVR